MTFELMDARREAALERNRQREQENERLRKEAEAQETERRRLRTLRDTEPTDYAPPTSADEFLMRYASGERYFARAQFSSLDICETLSYVNLSSATLVRCTFRGRVDGCVFDNANLNDVHFDPSSQLSHCQFHKTVIQASTLAARSLDHTSFTSCDIRALRIPRTLSAGRFCDITFSAELVTLSSAGMCWSGTHFENCRFNNIHLGDMRGSLQHCAFTNCSYAGILGGRTERTRFHDSAPRLIDGLTGDVAFVNVTFPTDSRLSNANLTSAEFEDCALQTLTIEQCKALYAKGNCLSSLLSGKPKAPRTINQVNFGPLTLQNSAIEHLVLSQCTISGGDFAGSTFRDVHFQNTTVADSSLENTSFQHVTGLEFDGNYLSGARLGRAFDNTWITLRREYSGHRMAFHLLLLAVFLIPIFVQIAFWSGVNRAQEARIAERLANNTHLVAPTPCGTHSCHEWRVIELVLHRNEPLHAFLLAIALLTYNFCRALLTLKVGPLRDDEDRSGYAPMKVDYIPLRKAHRVMRVLVFVALTSLCYHLYSWLRLPVSVPVPTKVAPSSTGDADARSAPSESALPMMTAPR